MPAFTLYYLAVVISLAAARCPQTKKAHPTSCTLFYTCVDLPSGGGFVWVPSKCADGLVFQPYLRLCVLPGDLWECASSTQAPVSTSDRENAQVKRQDTSNYLEPTPNSLVFPELIDHPLTTDAISASPTSETITPYPLVEIAEATEETEREIINPAKDSLCSHTDNKVQNTMEMYSLLSNLINRLVQREELNIPLESLISPNENDLIRNTQHNVLTNYLIQNYIQQNNLQTTLISSGSLENATTQVSINDILVDTNNENPELTIANIDRDSNIVLIKDNSGNKQYLTVEKYLSHPQYSSAKYAIVVPCVRNIRLPNATDCIKYYTCDPATALVMEYSCPQNTAFNKYSRVCDTESRLTCTDEATGNAQGTPLADQDAAKPTLQKMCAELGKMKDPSSDYHYFICYAPSSMPSTHINSIRLACPNGLVFCQSKKFCTTRRLCTSSVK